MFLEFFSLSFNCVKREFCIGSGEGELQENFEKEALFYSSLCTDPPPPALSPAIFTEGGGSLYTGYFMRETRNYRKVWILSWILQLWILSQRLLSRIVAISTTIIFLSPMFTSLYFYSFPSPPPLPHYHCFPSTTIRNTTYLRNLLLCHLCLSLIINMKKQRRKIKNVVSPALIIQHANTNSDIICFIAKNCSLIFIC